DIPRSDSVKLAHALIDQHLVKSSYERFPKYTFGELEKGIFCPECPGEMVNLNRKSVVCQLCGLRENNETSIMRNVKEFQFLFPQRDITSRIMFDWIGNVISKKAI